MHNDFGERTEKKDSLASSNTRHYYYNDNWQILSEYDSGGTTHKRSYIYGNYIDEVLMSFWFYATSQCKYYLHDHLYSPAAVANYFGQVVERYEYDAYGKCYIMDASYNPRSASLYGNPYYFSGREMDFLDNGSLKIMNYRHRYYDTYTGRFSTHDPMEYTDSMNLYEYVKSDPVSSSDSYGLSESSCTHCDYRYIKYCYVKDEAIIPGIATSGSHLQPLAPSKLSLSILRGIAACSASEITKLAGGIAQIIAKCFPSKDFSVTVGIRASKVERFTLINIKCGKNCIWDLAGAKMKIKDLTYLTEWEKSDPIPAIYEYIFPTIDDLIKENCSYYAPFFRPTPYCHHDSLLCKRGTLVSDRSDPEKKLQLCEKFQWKMKD